MSLLKEELTHVPVWVKFHDVPLVAYISNGLSLMATKIGTTMMLDSYTNLLCLESCGRSSYSGILIEINACNEFSDHSVMAVPNLEGNGYTKETNRIEYEWESPRCRTCLIFGHSPIDCPIVTPKRVVNQKDKVIEEVATGSMATTLGTQEEGQSSTPIVDKINVLEKQILEGKLVLVDDDGETTGVRNTKKRRNMLNYLLAAAEKIQADCDMKATNIILQGLPADIYSLERKCKLYDAFDKFTHIKGESLHTYYLRFTQLINDMNIYKMNMEHFQVNTKFLNSLPPEWSKFVTDVKLIKDLHTSNYDQLHAYLEQHELNANEVRLIRDDLIACLNKAMSFLTAVASSRFPSTNNQLRTSYNTRNQATIQDDRVTVQQVQGRQGKNYSGTTYKGNATSSRENTTSGHARVVKFYNFQGEQLAFLADPGILAGQVQTIIRHIAAFQTEDLDTYDSDCDDLSNTQAVLMANISNYGSDVISELRIFNPTIESSLPPVKVKVPSELPKVSLVNESLKKLKFQLAQFDSVVKKMTTPNAFTEGEWVFEHTQAIFNNEIIPFLKSLKNIFNVFDKDLLNEITKVKIVFDQIEAAVQQSLVDKQCLESANKEFLLENDRLSQQIISQDIVSTVLNCTSLNVDCMNVDTQRSESCEKYLNLDAEFSKSKQEYNDLLYNNAPIKNSVNDVKFGCLCAICGKCMISETLHECVQLVVKIVLWYLDSGCSKHMTGNRSQLMNFVSKFLGTVRFGNDQIARIMGLLYRKPFFDPSSLQQNSIRAYANKKPDLSFLHIFGSLYNPINDHEDLGKFNAKADSGIFVGYAPTKKAFKIYNRRTWIISETIHVTFDELTAMASKQFTSGPRLHVMTPATPIQEAAAPRAEVSANSVSISISQDAPSTSIPSLQAQEHSPIISQGFKESPKTPTFYDDPLNESSQDSHSQGSSFNVIQIHTPFEHLGRWTKDHPIAKVISDPSRSVSTRKKLKTNAMWCYFDAFLSSIEPKNFKQAMTKPS
nr:hypothetical protein [Tanacetum cinerariifolium]